MNKELMRRIKLAGSYQRKAILALLPEEVTGHLDVIGQEMQALAFEVGARIVKDLMSGAQEAAPAQATGRENGAEGTMAAGRKAMAEGMMATGGENAAEGTMAAGRKAMTEGMMEAGGENTAEGTMAAGRKSMATGTAAVCGKTRASSGTNVSGRTSARNVRKIDVS